MLTLKVIREYMRDCENVFEQAYSENPDRSNYSDTSQVDFDEVQRLVDLNNDLSKEINTTKDVPADATVTVSGADPEVIAEINGIKHLILPPEFPFHTKEQLLAELAKYHKELEPIYIHLKNMYSKNVP
jgi:hypothetical protein